MLHHETAPVVVTDKLFWNKFPFRVDLKHREKSAEWPQGRFFNRYLSETSARWFRKALMKQLPKGNDVFRYVPTETVQMVYFEHQADAQQFMDKLDPNFAYVIRAHAPKDETHQEQLDVPAGIVTRNTPFHGKYHWRVRLNMKYRTHQREDVKKWLEDVFEDDRSRYYLMWHRRAFIVYLRDEDDVIMLRLAHSAAVARIDSIKLLNNNNNNEGSFVDEPVPVSHPD